MQHGVPANPQSRPACTQSAEAAAASVVSGGCMHACAAQHPCSWCAACDAHLWQRHADVLHDLLTRRSWRYGDSRQVEQAAFLCQRGRAPIWVAHLCNRQAEEMGGGAGGRLAVSQGPGQGSSPAAAVPSCSPLMKHSSGQTGMPSCPHCATPGGGPESSTAFAGGTCWAGWASAPITGATSSSSDKHSTLARLLDCCCCCMLVVAQAVRPSALMRWAEHSSSGGGGGQHS